MKLFREAAGYYGLGYTVETPSDVDLPAYTGLDHAAATRSAGE